MSNRSLTSVTLDLDDIPEVVLPTSDGDTFTVTGTEPGQGEGSMTVQVSDFPGRDEIVRGLAEIWQQRGLTNTFLTQANDHRDLVFFWTWCGEGQVGITSFKDITPKVLLQFTQHVHTRKDASQTVAHVRNYFWWYDQQNPGELPEGTRNELTHNNPVPRKQSQPTEGMPQPVLRAVLRAADTHIKTLRHDLRKHREAGQEFYPTWEQSLSLYIALLFILLWSEDVLKTLVLDPPDHPTLVRDDDKYLTKVLSWDNEQLVVLFHKNRAGSSGTYVNEFDGQDTSTDGDDTDFETFADGYDEAVLLRLLQDATADLRAWHEHWRNTAPEDVQKRFPRFSPWLFGHTQRRNKDGSINGNETRRVDWPVIDVPVYTSIGWGTVQRLVNPTFLKGRRLSFRTWAERQQFPPDVWELMEDLTWDLGRLTVNAYGVLHKVARQLGVSLDIVVKNHTIKVHARHYMNERVTMQELHAAYLDTTDIAREVAEVGARPAMPLVLLSEHEQLTELDGYTGLSEPLDDLDVINELLAGTRNALIGCRSNGKGSPFMSNPASDEDCPVMWRLCFSCPLAVVTPGHITTLKRTRMELLRRQPTMIPEVWATQWKPIVTFIETVLQLPGFSDSTSTRQFPYIPLDPGVQGR